MENLTISIGAADGLKEDMELKTKAVLMDTRDEIGNEPMMFADEM